MRRLQFSSATTLYLRAQWSSRENYFLHTADFCTTMTTKHRPWRCAQKIKAKEDLLHALIDKGGERALARLQEFLDQKNISLLDCNEILYACQNHRNPQVAHAVWIFMRDRKIKLNTFSVACLLMALSGRGLLDEALEILYKLGKDIDVEPSIIFCGIFLNGCSYAGSASHAEKCLRYIKNKGLKEDEVVYLELMKLAGRRNDLPAVHKAWSLIVKTCKPSLPSLECYAAAVKALCAANSFEEALSAFKEMMQLISRREGFTMLSEKVQSLKSLYKDEDMKHLEIFSNSKGGRKKALDAQVEVKESVSGELDNGKTSEESLSPGSKPRQTCQNVHDDGMLCSAEADLDGSPYSELLGWTKLAMLNLQESESGNNVGVFSDKYARVQEMLQQTFNAIINAAVNKGDTSTAEVLFGQMRAANLKPDIFSYNAMLRAVVRGRGLGHGFQLIGHMEKDGIEPDTKTYSAIMEGFCSAMELDKAEALLERMVKMGGSKAPSDVSFNVLLKACGDSDDEVRALRVFAKMVETKVKPSTCTIVYLLSAFGRVNYPFERGTQDSQQELIQRLSAIEAYMEHAKLSHSFRTFNEVLCALSAEGMADAVVQRLNHAEGHVGADGQPLLSTITFNTAINACNQAYQWNAATSIFKKMQGLGLKPTIGTYNTLINGCAGQKKIGDAFLYLERLQEEGLKPNLITVNSLMKVCCYSNKLDAAVDLLKEIGDLGISPCVISFIILLSCAVKQERLDMVEFLVEHMHRLKVQPNMNICELVVSSYLNCHQIEDAAEALRVLSIRMLPQKGNMRLELEQLLKRIFLEDSLKVEESTLELFKDALGYMGPVSEALLVARLSGYGNADMDEWDPEKSWWSQRLRAQYIDMLV